ncbi:MAG: hypothetical protein KKD39_05045 [Candidatus Altiarchaeota archaeon]|nr:hypothetical protein [Candidatus Altiarchaeota archaeon]
MEYFCESGFLKSRIDSCGGKCIGGKCCKTESSSCTSSKECCSGQCKVIGMTHYCISP